MSVGLVVQKCGMTRIFTEEGRSVPVTVLKADTVRVTQLKTEETDGYNAIQVTYGEKKPSRINKPDLGQFKKAKVEPGLGLHEFRLDKAADLESYSLGHELNVQDLFSEGQIVDVTATSKGKGFAGCVKRHNFKMQDATHGNSLSHRAPGSIGQNQTPGRVFKGKKMSGQMGNVKTTVQRQEVVKVDEGRGLILVKGTVPGAPGGQVIIRPTTKPKRSGEK